MDITELLDSWPFDPESNVRHIRTPAGEEKIQVRIEQGPFRGILQMDLEGRPDGLRPHDRDFAMDYWFDRQKEEEDELTGVSSFTLDREACKELFEESRRIYERYAFLLQIADFERVIRDTERNMRLFRFVHKFAVHPDDRENLERWWPYILRIHGTARAMLTLREEGARAALAQLEATRKAIAELRQVDAVEFRLELERSTESLDELEKEIREQLDPTPRERLEQQLTEAVANEAFEEAARLRDQLNALDS